MLDVFITNLAEYNRGNLVGEWVELPMDEDELSEELSKVLGNDEEYFITDYEAPFEVKEYTNVFELNELAEELKEINEEKDVINAIFEYCSKDEGMEVLINGGYRVYHDCRDMEDVAMQIVEELGYLNEIPENLQMYFDYEAYGRDLDINGTFIEAENNKFVEIIN